MNEAENDELLMLSDEQEPVPSQGQVWHVLSVDDDPHFRQAIAFSLRDFVLLDRPVVLTQARSIPEAIQILAGKTEFGVILVDVVMETDNAGLRLVKAIRETLGLFDSRIVLLTGQPGFAPIDSVMEHYDLSDYCLKADLNRRGIKNVLTGALRSYRDICAISFARRSLNLIIETSNRLSGKQRKDEIASIVLQEVNQMLSLPVEGLVCVQAATEPIGPPEQAHVIAAAGRYRSLVGKTAADLPEAEIIDALMTSLHNGRDVQTSTGKVITFPAELCFERYAAYIPTRRSLEQSEYELLKVFVDTAARGFGTANLLNSLQRQAFVDPLLEIGNRNAIVRGLRRVIDDPSAVDFNLLAIDIDDFNGVCIAFGTEHATRLLIAVREKLREDVPGAQLLARVPPDQFFLIGPAQEINLQTIAPIFDTPIVVDGNEYHLTTCRVTVPVRPSSTPEDILRAANSTMRSAKSAGPGSSRQYDPAIEEDARYRFATGTLLERALSGTALRTVVQPQIDLRTGRPVGGEILLRWKNGEAEVPPSEFIPIAEKSTLIHKIGRFVVMQALDALQSLARAGLEHIVIGINVSLREFDNENLVAEILDLCRTRSVSVARLELEVVETGVMSSYEKIAWQLDQFRSAGGHVAIDDFGTGMSSLSHLLELPFDRIKIDRSFVAMLERNATSQRLTNTVVELGRRLGKTVIAEGVEDARQFEWLQTHGCHQGQGWYFSRPIDLDAFIEYCR